MSFPNRRTASANHYLARQSSSGLVLVIMAAMLPSSLSAQQGALAFADLPESPQVQSAAEQDLAGVSGLVVDPTGAVIAGAQVILTETATARQRTLAAAADGTFTFAGLAPASYQVFVSSPGFARVSSAVFSLAARQVLALPRIVLPIATATVVIDAEPVEVIAAEQIKVEEKQRVLGIFPNFYISYTYDAAPLTTGQKFNLFLHDTFDPGNFVGVGIGAGIQQADNAYPGYGEGAAGYGKRFAAVFGNGLTNDLLAHAVLPSLLHEDPRYFYQGTGSVRSRAWHAVSFAAVLRSDTGRLVPNYSALGGDLGSGALANLYYPHANRSVGLVFITAAIGFAGRAGGSLVEEFASKLITTNAQGNGKP